MSAWHDDRQNLALVARHMGEQGDTVEEVAYMLEKPWKFDDEWRRANVRAVDAPTREGTRCPACGDPMPYLCAGPDYCDRPTGGGGA